MSETIIIPWYATGMRADGLAPALNEIAAVAMHYGATSYAVYRSRDDRYRFQQFATFPDHLDWERYWEGPEMIDFRAQHSSQYQVPVLYVPWERTAFGAVEEGAEVGRISASDALDAGADGAADGAAATVTDGARLV